MSTVISVIGHAEERIAPELAAVSVTIAASAAEARAAVEAAAEAHRAVVDDVRGLESDGVIDRWSAGQVRTSSHRPWNADGKQLPPVFDARTRLEVVFTDFERLAAWVAAIGTGSLVRVDGIDWRLTDATNHRVRESAQRGAVADAVAKAAVYAEALGLGAPTAVELADAGLLGTQPAPAAFAAPVALRASVAAAPDATPELAPEELVIEASVNARFTAEPA